MVRDVDDLLALGENLDFFVKLQNCSEFPAYISNTKITVEYENGKAQVCRMVFANIDSIDGLAGTIVNPSRVVSFDIIIYQGHHYIDSNDSVEKDSSHPDKCILY
jgi:hypothetical protein